MSAIKNFLFHRVSPHRDPLWDPMDIPLFERCIRFISSSYRVVLLEELAAGGRQPAGRTATIVFDDGYKDNIEYALPILQKYGVPASFYVVTRSIDLNIPTWTYNLDYVFQHTGRKSLKLDFDFLPAGLRSAGFENAGSRLKFGKMLKPFLKQLTHSRRKLVLETIHACFDDVILPSLMMDWDDLRQIRDAGHNIGSHTVNHYMLGTMENEEDIYFELSGSAERIEAELGYFPSTISYPVGSYSEKVKELSRKAGYKMGLAVRQMPYQYGADDIFEIPRIELYNESWLKTRLRMNGSLGQIARLLGRR